MSRRKSHVYVLPAWVDDRDTRDPDYNAHRKLVDRYYLDLPPAMQAEHNRLTRKEREEMDRLRKWAPKFFTAYVNGKDLPTIDFGRTIAVDTSTEKGREDLESIPAAYFAVLKAGRKGVTSIEARLNGEVGGGPSGSLTKLHKAGVIACLEEKR